MLRKCVNLSAAECPLPQPQPPVVLATCRAWEDVPALGVILLILVASWSQQPLPRCEEWLFQNLSLSFHSLLWLPTARQLFAFSRDPRLV